IPRAVFARELPLNRALFVRLKSVLPFYLIRNSASIFAQPYSCHSERSWTTFSFTPQFGVVVTRSQETFLHRFELSDSYFFHASASVSAQPYSCHSERSGMTFSFTPQFGASSREVEESLFDFSAITSSTPQQASSPSEKDDSAIHHAW